MTYGSVLSNREFSAMLLGHALSSFGDQVARIALAVLVFRQTHSPLAASATYAVFFFGYLVAGPFVSALSDRLARRGVMVTSDLARAGLMLLLALPHLPVVVLFVLLVVVSLLTPAFESARSATLPDVLAGEAYPKGQALFNVAFQGTQVAGFVAGGALLSAYTVSELLTFNAATFLVSAGVILGWTLGRPPAAHTRPPSNVFRETAEGFSIVTRDPKLRLLLAYALLGAAAVATPEGLAVPVAAELHGGSLAAGVLTSAIPAGFVIASVVVLRLPPERRISLLPLLAALATVPLLATPAATSVPAVTLLWLLSGLGSSLQLVASSAYGQAVPPHARARAFGLATSGLMAVQGLAQLAGGALAVGVGPRAAVSLFALFVLVVLLGIGRAGTNPALLPQESPVALRENAS